MAQDTPRVIDPATVRQLTREAVSGQPDRMASEFPDRSEFERTHGMGEHRAMLRAITYAIGGTYHVGYDTAAREAYTMLYDSVVQTVNAAASEYNADEYGSVDRAVRVLLGIGEATGAHVAVDVARPTIVRVEGSALATLRRYVQRDVMHDQVTHVRFVVDGGLKVKCNEEMWTPPLGTIER
jgi:hypothetical protein